jgi:hypothetical protein
MFGTHIKHDILSLKDGALYLRDIINKEMKKGKLSILIKKGL